MKYDDGFYATFNVHANIIQHGYNLEELKNNVIKGIDSKSRSIVASRSEAMYKKRQTFYMETDKNGMFRIYEDRIVQARVIAVAEKAIRVESNEV